MVIRKVTVFGNSPANLFKEELSYFLDFINLKIIKAHRTISNFRSLSFAKKTLVFITIVALIIEGLIIFMLEMVLDFEGRVSLSNFIYDIAINSNNDIVYFIFFWLALGTFRHLISIIVLMFCMFLQCKYLINLLYDNKPEGLSLVGLFVSVKDALLKFMTLSIGKKLLIISLFSLFICCTLTIINIALLYSLPDIYETSNSYRIDSLFAKQDKDYYIYIHFSILRFLILCPKISIFLLGLLNSIILKLISIIINEGSTFSFSDFVEMLKSRIRIFIYRYIIRFSGIYAVFAVMSIMPIESMKDLFIHIMLCISPYLDLLQGRFMMNRLPKPGPKTEETIEDMVKKRVDAAGRRPHEWRRYVSRSPVVQPVDLWRHNPAILPAEWAAMLSVERQLPVLVSSPEEPSGYVVDCVRVNETPGVKHVPAPGHIDIKDACGDLYTCNANTVVGVTNVVRAVRDYEDAKAKGRTD